MVDKTIVITGDNAGLGYQCAKQVATAGPEYQVVLACRSAARGETAAETLRTETGNPNITSVELDLASLASVRAFAGTFSRAALPPLYAVVCNAGISAAGVPGTPSTADGVETIFGVNHLGHFLLANLLLGQTPGGLAGGSRPPWPSGGRAGASRLVSWRAGSCCTAPPATRAR
jgi:NAD(P)-dependent dehydrogenase (short-subunit alcohol dehydrogenase family)